MSAAVKTLTIRLPVGLYHSGTELAKRRRKSLNALVQDGLTALLKDEEYERLYQAFGELGEDAEECDVEFAMPAQREVIGDGDS